MHASHFQSTQGPPETEIQYFLKLFTLKIWSQCQQPPRSLQVNRFHVVYRLQDRASANVPASCLYTCVTFTQRGVSHICSSETLTGQMLTWPAAVHWDRNPNNQQLHYTAGQPKQRLRKLCLSENCCFISLEEGTAGSCGREKEKGVNVKLKDHSVLICDGENRGVGGDGEEKKRYLLVSKKKKDKCLTRSDMSSQTRHDLMLYHVLNLKLHICSEKAPLSSICTSTRETLEFTVCRYIRLSKVNNNAAVSHRLLYMNTHTHTHTHTHTYIHADSGINSAGGREHSEVLSQRSTQWAPYSLCSGF